MSYFVPVHRGMKRLGLRGCAVHRARTCVVNMMKKSKVERAGLEAVKQVAVDEEKLISSEVEGEKVSYLSCPRATFVLTRF